MRDVIGWIISEYEARLEAGKTHKETTAEVKAIVEEHGRVMEVWHAKSEWLLSNIFAAYIRDSRRHITAQEAEQEDEGVSASATTEAHEIFGQRRVNTAVLARRGSMLDQMIWVGNDYIRFGDMTRKHWGIKVDQYRLAADNAETRYWAASMICQRLTEGKRTEECLTEIEFRRLYPACGF